MVSTVWHAHGFVFVGWSVCSVNMQRPSSACCCAIPLLFAVLGHFVYTCVFPFAHSYLHTYNSVLPSCPRTSNWQEESEESVPKNNVAQISKIVRLFSIIHSTSSNFSTTAVTKSWKKLAKAECVLYSCGNKLSASASHSSTHPLRLFLFSFPPQLLAYTLRHAHAHTYHKTKSTTHTHSHDYPVKFTTLASVPEYKNKRV